ncbi:Stp1/IreP family PP2C-type Ser/Thr phosphatase [Candidatus Poribacteria bacterium]
MNVLKKILNEVNTANKSAYGATDVGLQRDSNQDNLLLLPAMGLYIVADGMGGHNAGEVASLNAIKSMGKYFTSKHASEMKKGSKIKEKLEYAVLMAHDRIVEMSEAKAEYAGMGSTVAISFVHENILHTCHVGDSRVYVINPSGITQITRDHSTVAEFVRQGEMTREEARYSSVKNEVTQALGVSLSAGPEYNRTYELNEGDVVLLCSDGLWDMLSDDEIRTIVVEADTMKDACNELIQQANAAGGEDNITAILVQINGNGSH